MNKNEKKNLAFAVIAGVLLLLAALNSPTGRAGFDSSFNEWYADNDQLALFLAIAIILFMIFWGFYESKDDKKVRALKAQTRMYEAYGRSGLGGSGKQQ